MQQIHPFSDRLDAGVALPWISFAHFKAEMQMTSSALQAIRPQGLNLDACMGVSLSRVPLFGGEAKGKPPSW